MNALGETVVVRHPFDRQVFNGDRIKLIDDATAVLMGKVAPPPCDAFMHMRDCVAAFGALWRSYTAIAMSTAFAMSALCPGKRFLLTTEKARVGDRCAGAQSSKAFQPHVNPHLLSGFGQWRWFTTLTGEANVPFAGAAATDGGRLGRAFQHTMQDDLHLAHPVQSQTTRLKVQLAAARRLRIGNARIAPTATKTWVSRRLTSFHPAKDRLERQVKSHGDVLPDLRVHLRERGTLRLEFRQRRLLVVQAQRFLPFLPSGASCGQQVIVQPAPFLQLLREKALLLPGRIQAILERLTEKGQKAPAFQRGMNGPLA
jgi:hypothetical protein